MKRINLWIEEEVWSLLTVIAKQIQKEQQKKSRVSKSDLIRRAVKSTYICQSIRSENE